MKAVRGRISKFKIIEWVLALGLGGFFLWSGAVKLMDLDQFTKDVGNFQLSWEIETSEGTKNVFDAPTDAYIAYNLPWFEVMTGLALVSGFWRAGGALMISGMLVAFNLALYNAWSRGLNINCGCFGQSDEPVNYPWKIGSNFGLLLVAVIVLLVPLISSRSERSTGSDKDLTES